MRHSGVDEQGFASRHLPGDRRPAPRGPENGPSYGISGRVSKVTRIRVMSASAWPQLTMASGPAVAVRLSNHVRTSGPSTLHDPALHSRVGAEPEAECFLFVGRTDNRL